MLLALDLSLSNTGGCIFTDSGSPLYIFSIPTSSKDETKERLAVIGKFLENIKNIYKINEVAIEKGFFRYAKSTQVLYEVLGVAMYVLNEYNQYFYAPSSIRKTLTGNGGADKKDVEEYILKKFPGLKMNNLDESDAVSVGICHFAKNKRQLHMK